MNLLSEAFIGSSAAFTASANGSLPVDPESIEAVSRWPLTVILGAVCSFCVWLMYKQSKDFAKTTAEVAEKAAKTTTENAMAMSHAITELVSELKQRPWIRDPKND